MFLHQSVIQYQQNKCPQGVEDMNFMGDKQRIQRRSLIFVFDFSNVLEFELLEGFEDLLVNEVVSS